MTPGSGQGQAFGGKAAAATKAKLLVEPAGAGQVVVHDSQGACKVVFRRGLMRLQQLPYRSKRGRQAIRRAVSGVIRDRLAG